MSKPKTQPRVLISDKMNPLAAEIFRKNNIDVVEKTGLSEEELIAEIPHYDGLAVRSSTDVTPKILDAAKNLKVVGRAGIGIDNIDLNAATEAGVIVMNTPFGNSITTAEHAISMMMALARQIPQANASTHAGKWEKKKFMGVELYRKVLGVIGCGNIGRIVVDRAQGLKMQVIAYDPFLTEEKAVELGVEKVDLDTLFARSDFITIHVPKNEKTTGLINKQAFDQMQEGVRIINCARGGLIVEEDLKDALDSGKVAGAALDVFEKEPATDNILFNHPNVICTPHLGAATTEAQVNVAIQVAEQISDFLNCGAVSNAINMASITAEEAPRLKPYLNLATQLGSFAGQILEGDIQKIEIFYAGNISDVNTSPLTATIIAEIMRPMSQSINLVNALIVAEGKGIQISSSKSESQKNADPRISVVIHGKNHKTETSGTLFANQYPRIVNIEGVPIEAALSKHMLFIRNEDQPGLIGKLGMILGQANQNISDFRLGRIPDKKSAVCLVCLDQDISDDLFKEIKAISQVKQAQRLSF